MLDSGAFSAFTGNKTIDLKEYIQFIRDNLDVIENYIVLDCIGNHEQSWLNQEAMERAGLKPLPVFHVFSDPITNLYRCVDNYEYFCIGSTGARYSAMSHHSRTSHLDRVFSIICDTPDHLPKCKVHALGLQSPRLLWRYPFFSFDASTWKVQSGYSHAFIPDRKEDGKWIYDEKFRIVSCSERVTARCHKVVMECLRKGNYPKGSVPISGTNHVENQPRNRQQLIYEYIKDIGQVLGRSEFKIVPHNYKREENEVWCWPSSRWSKKEAYTGKPRVVEIIKERGIGNHYYSRLDMNLNFFLRVEENLPEWPWPYKVNWHKHSFGLVK